MTTTVTTRAGKGQTLSWTEGDANFTGLRDGINNLSVSTVAAMKLLSVEAGETIQTQGYYTAGDGGGATYLIVAPQAFDGYGDHELANGNIAVLQLNGSANVLFFGAKGDGSTDDTAAIQAANDYFSTGWGSIYLPKGTYLVIATLTIDQDAMHIYGDGERATTIKFEPTVNDTCILVDKGSTVSYQGSIRHISFISNDTTYEKIAIHLIDHSGWVVDNCGTYYPHWQGNDSIFLRIDGREHGRISNIYAYADKPLVCGAIPSPHTPDGIGMDQHNFHNMYLVATAANPVGTFETGLILTQCSFTGAQSWVGGTYGLYWNDTTSAAVSTGLVLNDVRWEQGSDSSAYLVYINHNVTLQGLNIKGGQGGDRKGFYLRNVDNVHFDTFYYTSTTLEALNVDSTVRVIEATACFWQAGSTANVTGQKIIFEAPKLPNTGALPPSFHYTPSSNNASFTVGDVVTGTPTLNNFTIVLGGGTVTTTSRYTRVGKQIHLRIEINAAGGATVASTSGTSYITGNPTAAYDNTVTAVGSGTVELGIGWVTVTSVLTPTWAARTGKMFITAIYEVA